MVKENSKKAVTKSKAKAEPVAKSAAKKNAVKKASKINECHEHGCSCSSHPPKKMQKINIGVFFGGRSSEHEVSLVSAKSIIDALDRKKYNIIPVGINKNGNFVYLEGSYEPEEIMKKGTHAIFISQPNINYNLWVMDKKQESVIDLLSIDLAIPVLHGPYGEDGKIQALFEMADIPYVGSDVLGSACGMDKIAMKNLFISYDLPIVNFAHFTFHDYMSDKKAILDSIKKSLVPPFFVKPANLGSSVGISRVTKVSDLNGAIENALKYDYKVVVEQGMDVREIEVAIMGNFDLMIADPGEVLPAAEFYDYDDKYKNGKTKFEIPAKLSKKQAEEIKELAVAAYRAIDAKGFARVDLFIDKKTGEAFVNEINTIPGFTSISMFPKMFEKSGVSYNEILEHLIDFAIEIYDYKCGLEI